MVGPLRTLEIPNLNKIYEDDTVECYIHDVYSNGELLVFHADVQKSLNKDLLLHYRDVMQEIFAALKQKGVKELQAWVVTDKEIKYAQFMGFDQFLGELTIGNRPIQPPVYVLKKEL